MENVIILNKKNIVFFLILQQKMDNWRKSWEEIELLKCRVKTWCIEALHLFKRANWIDASEECALAQQLLC